MSTDLTWHKSSYSGGDGSACVEVALSWHKSSYSDGEGGGECLEVARTPPTVHLRDSKRKDGPHLSISATAWADFLRYVPDV
ncbi:DUF397 domain-containing protein [Streptomyces sp. NPDC046261]|uniref:DUF397 domain-containing protein n=1 Tax=Streptomyces sp. NPDC046261 TaxID=3157200 RepID=UPI0033F35581